MPLAQPRRTLIWTAAVRETSPEDRLAEERLELIPRHIRDNLDRIGIKLHLKEWQSLPLSEREYMRDEPCATPAEFEAYHRRVVEFVVRATGQPPQKLPRRT